MVLSGTECDLLLTEHTRSAIAERLERRPPVSYLRDFVDGAIDGAVTTSAPGEWVVLVLLTLAPVTVVELAKIARQFWSSTDRSQMFTEDPGDASSH